MDYDYLTESGVKIKQSYDGYRFTSDAIALAEFVKCKHTDTVIDAGCGGGVISLIVNERCKPKLIVAVDIQKQATDLALENAKLNGMTNINVYHADIRTFYKQTIEINGAKVSAANFAEVIVCNPPYFFTGHKNKKQEIASARHDDTLSLTDLAQAATKLLKYGGALYMCYPAKYVAKAIAVLENNNFRIKHLKFLNNQKETYLVLIHAKKGGGDGTVVSI